MQQEALEALLERLDPDREEAGRRYEQIREKLIRVFQWRGCDFPEELADEALDRVAEKLHEGLEIQASDPFRYICGVAHLVFKEMLRRQERQRKVLDQEQRQQKERQRQAVEARSWSLHPEPGEEESLLACLRQCLEDHSTQERELVLRYHQGEKRARIENRRRLAGELDLGMNALRIRAFRIRERLERCVEKCMARNETDPRVTES